MNLQNQTLVAVQLRLQALACPLCQKTDYLVLNQPERGYAQDIYRARCTHCAYSFPISIQTRPFKETDPDTAQWLATLPCPACQHAGVHAEFRAMPSVRECIYFVTCQACNQPFTEKAPMEAYE